MASDFSAMARIWLNLYLLALSPPSLTTIRTFLSLFPFFKCSIAAALHWLNSIPNALIAEFVAQENTNLREFLTRQKIRAQDGYLEMPQAPGLGIELDEEALARFRVS